MKLALYGLALAGLVASQTAAAQDRSPPVQDSGTSWKYFYFHKPGVSEEKAKEDIAECQGYTENLVLIQSGPSSTYTSVPYGGTTGLSYGQAAGVGFAAGIAGAIIGGFVDAANRRNMVRVNLRRCFGFKGYDRYELSKEDYQELMSGTSEQVRERLLKKATGPAPQAPRLVP